MHMYLADSLGKFRRLARTAKQSNSEPLGALAMPFRSVLLAVVSSEASHHSL